MHSNQLSDTFQPFASPEEMESGFGRMDNTQQLILILRKLLDSTCNVFYRHTPEGGYDSSDFCMGETTIFAYRKKDECTKGFFREIGRVIVDNAASITLEEGTLDFWGYLHGDRTSFGSIVGVYGITPMGNTDNISVWESCKLLLRNAAATNSWQRLTFPRIKADTYIVRLWDDSEGTHQDLAKVTTSNWFGRYSEHFAIELL